MQLGNAFLAHRNNFAEKETLTSMESGRKSLMSYSCGVAALTLVAVVLQSDINLSQPASQSPRRVHNSTQVTLTA